MRYGITDSRKTIPGTDRSHIPQRRFYDANEDLYFEIICDRSVSFIIQAFDRQDSKDMRLDELRAANDRQDLMCLSKPN
jgi:hypothetical protein